MLQLQRVCVQFGGHLAVDHVSLDVQEGEVLVLVGGSGSGKTTTLRTINRLVEPSAGRVLFDGLDVATIPGAILRRRIGYVLQKIGLFPHLDVEGNIDLALEVTGWPREHRAARVAEVLDLVELGTSFLGRRVDALSGGQQQRVAVARALAPQPRLLLLDEPFSALDPLTRDSLQQSFLGLRARLGFSAVFVTHDMAEALLLGDRVGVMRAGRLVQVGTPAQLVNYPADDAVERLLDTPQRQAQVYQRLRREASA